MAHDFYADTFDTIDGQHVLYSSRDPERKFKVVALLDRNGDDTDDPEEAAGGVVQLADECFTTFTWGGQ